MNAFAGTGALARFILRRERVALPIWVLVITLFVVGTAVGLGSLYATPDARAAFAAQINATLGEVALLGPVHAPDLGGLVAWRVGTGGAFLTAVMTLLTVLRHTRAEEDGGRRELLGAAPVGRLAPLAAVLLVTLGANLAFALLATVGLVAQGLSLAGSALLTLSLAGVGWVTAGLAAIAGQLAGSTRSTGTLVGSLLGIFYAIRIIGDARGLTWPVWASPFGWVREGRAFAQERWWVLLLPLLLTAFLVGLALALQARRDLGAALLPARSGRATTAPALRSPLALAWRLQGGLILAWGAVYLLVGLMLGWLAPAAGAQLQGSAPLVQAFGGARPGDALFTIGLSLLGGEGLAVYALLAALRPHGEETSGLADPLLAAPVTRARWLGGHLLIALLGSAAVLAAFGLGAGLGYGLSLGDVAGQLPRLLAAALAYAPAAWVLVGLAALLTGLWPRLGALAWVALGAFLAIDLLTELSRVGAAVQDLSPFAHVPRLLVPGAPLGGLAWLSVTAALLLFLGVLAWRRRDIG